jgi:hypothetical protein
MANKSEPFHDAADYSDDPNNFNHEPPKKKSRAIFGAVLLLAGSGIFLQTTLASNISLNSGAQVEFGQGITQTLACSGATDLTVTPNSSFTNESGGGAFYFSSLTISNVPAGCYGKDFTIRGYGEASSTPLALFNTTSTSAVVSNDTGGSFQIGTGGTGATVSSGSGTFTITFTSPVALASTVFRITVESGAHTPIIYRVGDRGPGGGIVFYVATTPFACGPTLATTCTYLEAAPTNGGAERLWTDIQISWATNVNSNQSTSAPGASEIVIGAGYKNSVAIESQVGNVAATSAAVAARAYRGPNNLTDWYLPTLDELNQLRIQKTAIRAVADAYYWSSSEMYPLFAWRRYFSDSGDNQGGEMKSEGTLYFRPIRAF